MTTNPNLLIPVYRVESQGHINTFESLDTSMNFLRAEAKAGKTPLGLSISTLRHSEYLQEVESQENCPVEGQEGVSK